MYKLWKNVGKDVSPAEALAEVAYPLTIMPDVRRRFDNGSAGPAHQPAIQIRLFELSDPWQLFTGRDTWVYVRTAYLYCEGREPEIVGDGPTYASSKVTGRVNLSRLTDHSYSYHHRLEIIEANALEIEMEEKNG